MTDEEILQRYHGYTVEKVCELTGLNYNGLKRLIKKGIVQTRKVKYCKRMYVLIGEEDVEKIKKVSVIEG